MKKILPIIVFLISLSAFGQSSEKYNSDYENFYRAEELFMKEQYVAARVEFRSFMDTYNKPNDPMYVKAAYYEGVSALELYNNDAIKLLLQFNKDYPESIYKMDIYFRLAKYYYGKRKYEDAIEWFNKLSISDVEAENRDEFYFKLGHSYFEEERFDEARNVFYEIKDGDSQYANPALYYYSYIAYQNESYETALEGFLKLESDEKFAKIAPYYIAQIYYLQGKYEKVTDYAGKISAKEGVISDGDLNLLIGDAYYKTGQYAKAVPFLEKNYRSNETSRDEKYALGYAYYRSGQYEKAIPVLDKVKREEDSLGQVSYYHIAECLLKLDNRVSARSAFEGAAMMDYDPVVSEDALWNYAILSYKLDINPYDEAVEAFELYLNRYPNSDKREDVYQYLVNVYTSTNNYEKALASLDKIPNKDIRLKAAYQLVAFNQGVKRFSVANYSGAIQSFGLVKKYPVDPTILAKAAYWTADARYRLHEYDTAISDYQKVIGMQSVPKILQQEARYNIGYAYLAKAEKYDEEEKFGLKRSMLKRAVDELRLFLQMGHEYDKKNADANLRIADAYFVLKENEQAVKFYKDVLQLKEGFEDQALFYMAKTYGYMNGRENDKITSLKQLIEKYPESKYLQRSLYEIARSYESVGQNNSALTYYEKLIRDYPQAVIVVDAKINVADIYFKQKKYNQAEDLYREVIETYGSDQNVCRRVAQGLKDLYLTINQPEKVEALAQEYACADISPDETENLYYLPAIESYFDSTKVGNIRYSEAIPKFEKYLSKFPNGRYQNEVKNFLADCHFQLGDEELAVDIYIETLEGPNTGFTEVAAARVAKFLYNKGEYEKVIPYYKRLETASSSPEVIFNAQLGLMRSSFLVENWSDAAKYAEKVLASSQINNELKMEGNYAKGMANFYLKRYAVAKPALEWVVDNTNTVRKAEALFSLAYADYDQEQLVEADQGVDRLLKMKPTYNFWVAKGLILRSRVLIQLEDLFGAEQNLKSVIDHYPIQDDGILDEANQLWDELMQLKNQNQEFEERTDPVIEIEEENGN